MVTSFEILRSGERTSCPWNSKEQYVRYLDSLAEDCKPLFAASCTWEKDGDFEFAAIDVLIGDDLGTEYREAIEMMQATNGS